MQLTKRQLEGLNITIERYKNKEKYVVIAGYAGSGKSFLVRFIIEALEKYGIKEDDVVYCAYTGKATQVLYRKGNKNVSTLHKLLYESYPLPNGGFKRKPVEYIPYRIVVVDEVSMPDKEIMNQLFKHDCFVICCGDPA